MTDSYWFKGLGKLGTGGFCIALSGVGVAASEALLMNREFDVLNFLIIALIVLGGYRLDYAAGAGDANDHTNWRRCGGSLLALGILITASILAWIYRMSGPALGLWIFPLLVFFYARPFAPHNWKWRCFKDIPYFKSVYTALAWGALPFYAAWLAGDHFQIVLTWLAIVTFLRMFINATACDFKDLESDRKNGIRSIPGRLGRRGTCRILHFVNLAVVLGTAALVGGEILPATVHWFHLTALYPALYLIALEREWLDDGWTASVLVDLEFVFWPLYLFPLCFLL